MKPWLIRSLKITIILLLLFTGAWQFENWRGHCALKKAEQRAADAGISLDLADYQPDEVPDEENLLKNDIFFNEWAGNIEPPLDAWASMNLPGTADRVIRQGSRRDLGEPVEFTRFFDGDLSEEDAEEKLSEASIEVQARLDRLAEIILSYPSRQVLEYLPTSENPSPQMHETFGLQEWAACFCDQGILSLRTGHPKIALRNIQVIEKLADCFEEPLFVHHLVADSMRQRAMSITWEGLRLRIWNEAQLQALLEITDPNISFDTLIRASKVELANSLFTLDHFEQIMSHRENSWAQFDGERQKPSPLEKAQTIYHTKGPSGWTGQRKAILINKLIENLENKEHWSAQDLNRRTPPEEVSLWNPFWIAHTGDAASVTLLLFELKTRTQKRVARLAILLELHFMEHGDYPHSLDELPDQEYLIDATDPQNKRFAYKLDAQGRPQIWSELSSEYEFRWQYHEDPAPANQPKKKSKKQRTPPVKSGENQPQ